MNTADSSDKPADYATLIDSETWDFIRQTESWYPTDTLDFSVQRQREIYNTMCHEFHHGYPINVSASDHKIKHSGVSVSVRRYTSETDTGQPNTYQISPSNLNTDKARIIYFHGGGFVVGDLQSHDDVCAELCDRTGFDVTSVDYRLAPEHVHPASFEDCLACVQHESQRTGQSIILCGDSAGGNLAAAVAHALRDLSNGDNKPDVIGQVLIYPALGGDMTSGSYITHAQAPMLTTQDVHYYESIRSADSSVHSHPTFAPLKDNNFSELPNTVVFSAECDPLSDDGRHYCESIVSHGGQARWVNESGLVHGYLRARHTVARAQDSFTRIVSALTSMQHHV